MLVRTGSRRRKSGSSSSASRSRSPGPTTFILRSEPARREIVRQRRLSSSTTTGSPFVQDGASVPDSITICDGTTIIADGTEALDSSRTINLDSSRTITLNSNRTRKDNENSEARKKLRHVKNVEKVLDDIFIEVIEIQDMKITLKKIFKDAGRNEYLESEDSTDEEDIIEEFVRHRKCNRRCRVRYQVKKDESSEVNEEKEEKTESEDETKDEVSKMKDPTNLKELKEILQKIQENHEDFKLEDIKYLKEIFLSWQENDRDVIAEEFEVYGEFRKARDAIRGETDTEDDEESDDEGEGKN